MAHDHKRTLTEQVNADAEQARRDRERYRLQQIKQGRPDPDAGTGAHAPGGRANVRERDKHGPADGLGGNHSGT